MISSNYRQFAPSDDCLRTPADGIAAWIDHSSAVQAAAAAAAAADNERREYNSRSPSGGPHA